MKDILKPEKRLTLAEMISDKLKKAIASGQLSPGDRLVEKEIADSLQTGRNAVREALRSLEREGYVTITPFKGAHVTETDLEEVRQMFEVMSGLEGMCASMAVRKMTEADLAEIERLHRDLETCHRSGDHDGYLETNRIYHAFIQELAKNEVLNRLVSDFRQKILLYRQRQLFEPDRFDASMNEHRAILEAFRSGDAKLAEEKMKIHLMRQGDALFKETKPSDRETNL